MNLGLPNLLDKRLTVVSNAAPGLEPIYYLICTLMCVLRALDPLYHYSMAAGKRAENPKRGFQHRMLPSPRTLTLLRRVMIHL